VLKNSNITLRQVNGKPGLWEIQDEVLYIVPAVLQRRHGGPDRIIVKVGFVTDLASIPKLFWNILPPFGRYTAAAVVHDYLYQAHEHTQRHADAIFLAAMTELKVSRWKRAVMHRAVRAFGGASYKNGPAKGGIV
jgi:hypothetical protein